MSLILDGSNGVSDIDGTAATPAIRGTDANTGIFFPAADTIAFSEGGAEAMRIDSSGNVQVNGYSSNGSANSLRVGNVTDYQGRFYLDSSPELFYIENTSDYVLSGIAFKTNGSERMRIDSSGRLIVGTGTALSSGKVQTYGLNSDYTQQVFQDYSSGTGYFIEFIRTTGAFASVVGPVGTITASTTNVSYNTSSDYRLKEDIAPMTGALAKVSALKPCTYKWKIDGSNGQGFIAHELQSVVPEAVTGEKDAVETYKDEDGNEQTRIKPQGVDTSFLVATLTAAIQELKVIVNAQAARIAALEAAP